MSDNVPSLGGEKRLRVLKKKCNLNVSKPRPAGLMSDFMEESVKATVSVLTFFSVTTTTLFRWRKNVSDVNVHIRKQEVKRIFAFSVTWSFVKVRESKTSKDFPWNSHHQQNFRRFQILIFSPPTNGFRLNTRIVNECVLSLPVMWVWFQATNLNSEEYKIARIKIKTFILNAQTSSVRLFSSGSSRHVLKKVHLREKYLIWLQIKTTFGFGSNQNSCWCKN